MEKKIENYYYIIFLGEETEYQLFKVRKKNIRNYNSTNS